MKSDRNGHHILFRFLIPYLLVLIIPTGISYIAYFEAFRSVREGVQDTNRGLLQRMTENVDRQLDEVHDLTFTISNDPRVIRFLSVSDYLTPSNYRYLRYLYQGLPDFQLTNSLIANYFIHFAESDVIISPISAAMRLPLFYGGSLQYDGLDFADWYERFFDTYHRDDILPTHDVYIDGKRHRIITYLQSIPMGYADVYDGTIMVLLDAGAIERTLSSLLIDTKGWVTVVDEEGNVIASVGTDDGSSLAPDALAFVENSSEIRIDDSTYHLTVLRSEKTGWSFISGLPKKVIQARLRYIQRLTVAATIVSIVLGTVLALMLAARSSRPIQGVLRALGTVSSHYSSRQVDFGSLQPAVAELISRNRDLQRDLHSQEPFVRDALFERILRGEGLSETELESLAGMSSFDIRAKRYLCLVLTVLGFADELDRERIQQLNGARVAIHEMVDRVFRSRCYQHDTQIDQLVLLLSFELNSDDHCYQRAENRCAELIKQLAKRYQITCMITGGRVVLSTDKIHLSYLEASHASPTLILEENTPVVWFTRSEIPESRYFYPLEKERELSRHLISGNLDMARSTVDEIYAENYENRSLDGPMSGSLMIELRGTITKLLNRQGIFGSREAEMIQRASREIALVDNVEAFFSSLDRIIVLICRTTSDRKKSHNSVLLDRIIAVIDDSCTDPNFTLGKAASYAGVSEVYLSQFFKEQTGETFSSYLTRVRIKHAAALLEDDHEFPISEVASRVGYSNPDTFRKAFKRVYGISPSAAKHLGIDSLQVEGY